MADGAFTPLKGAAGGPTNWGTMETLPAEALAVLDAAAGTVDCLLDAGIELHFTQPRFSRPQRRVRVVMRDAEGRTLAQLGLVEALDLLSA